LCYTYTVGSSSGPSPSAIATASTIVIVVVVVVVVVVVASKDAVDNVSNRIEARDKELKHKSIVLRINYLHTKHNITTNK
jgi:hypothetical protein